jgi:uncharacterized protein
MLNRRRVLIQQKTPPGSKMILYVHVTPNAREARVTKLSETSLEVKIDERAEGGKANKRLLEILSEYFNVPKSAIVIVRGTKSRDKVVELMERPRNKTTAQQHKIFFL